MRVIRLRYVLTTYHFVVVPIPPSKSRVKIPTALACPQPDKTTSWVAGISAGNPGIPNPKSLPQAPPVNTVGYTPEI